MKKIFAGALTCVLALSSLCACAKEESNESRKAYLYAMNTTAVLAATDIDADRFEKLEDSVREFLTEADNALSASRAGSDVYNFNRAEAGSTVKISETCYEVLKLAQEVYAYTDRYYNPAVYYCEDLYGFAARPSGSPAMPYDRDFQKVLPDEKYRAAFCELSTHFSEVEIFQSDGIYYATKPSYTVEADGVNYSLSLDLGGIAKGWCVDKVNAMMADAGLEYGYFDFGVSSIGVKKFKGGDGNYTIKSEDPRGAGYYASFKMRNANLSTSGDNRKYYEIDGTRYCHIIDPTTGAPVQTGVASVTIVGGQAGLLDALTTALAAMGKEKAVQFINEKLNAHNVVMLIFEDGKGRIITNAPDYFAIGNTNYELANTVENGNIVLKDVA